MEIKVEATVYEVKDGNVVSLKYNDTVFIPKARVKQISTEEYANATADDLDRIRGKPITDYGGNKIYENTWNEFVIAREKGLSDEEIKQTILKKHYPFSKQSSMKTYLNLS